MVNRCDFVVQHDPRYDNQEDLSKKVIYSLVVTRLKNRKPCVWFIGGDSGEGKSMAAIKVGTEVLEAQGIDYTPFVNDVNVYTPSEYPEKLQKLLFDKNLKKINVITVHEAREIVKAKKWMSFINQAIADVNAMSRSVKRMAFFIVSQFIRDISVDIRYTITYYSTVWRPKGGKPARLRIYRLWKDDRDLDKPKLCKRKIVGYLVDRQGKYNRYQPEYLELSMPDREVVKTFEAADRIAKEGIIKSKMQKLIAEIESDMGVENKKVGSMVEYYSKNTDSLNLIGRFSRGKYRTNKEFKEMHGLTKMEAEEFENKVHDILKKAGAINEEAGSL